MTRFRCAWLVVPLLTGFAAPAAAQVDPSPLIAPVVFHWQQVQTPWATLEGGSAGDASDEFWRRQVELLEFAGFTAQLFQVAHGNEISQRHHLNAMRELAAERGTVRSLPRIVPIFAAETFAVYGEPKDVSTPAGVRGFYRRLRNFFLMYASYFPAPGRRGGLDPGLLATVDGRVLIALWWVPLTDYRLPGDFFETLNDMLEADFGFRAYWSAHEAWAAGNPDDINYLFNGAAPLQRGRNPAHPAVDLLAAFWPPNLESYRREWFVPRASGQTYLAAWDEAIALSPRPEIVLVESYNEIAEGSHIMPSWPVRHEAGDRHFMRRSDDPACETGPCHQIDYADTWGPNPWHFIDLTRGRIRAWRTGSAPADRDTTPPHVLVLSPRVATISGGSMPIKAVAADDAGIRTTEVWLDGRLYARTNGSVDLTLDSWDLTNGRHRLTVEVFDSAGQSASDTREFVVQNPWIAPATAAPADTTAAAGGVLQGSGAAGYAQAAPAENARGTSAAASPAGRPGWPVCRYFELAGSPGGEGSTAAPEWREVWKPCLRR